MPKMRGIKPEIWTDEKFVELSPHARLLFVGMWHYACDNGHLEDRPKQLKMRVLPVDAVDPVELVDEMVTLGMVIRSDDGLTIPKLREHQRLDNRYFTWCDRCSLDEIPEPARSKHPDAQRGHDGRTTGTRSANAEPRVKEGRKEGEGDGEGASAGARRASQLPHDFKPSEGNIQLAISEGVDLDRELPKFCDHHAAKGSTFKDWNRALNTWIRNAVDYGPRRPATQPGRTPFPVNGTREEQDEWARRQPLPVDAVRNGGGF